MTGNLNTRFEIWARSIGRDPRKLLRHAEGEVTRIDGMPWTILFMGWMSDRWREWADGIGFRGDHRAALMKGHTHEEFDAWLAGFRGES